MKLYSLIAAVAAVSTTTVVSAWNMPVVTMIHARVTGSQPVFNSATNEWEEPSLYGGKLACSNTASMYGALQYGQAEVWPDSEVTNCQRRSNATFIVYYEVQISQPNATLAYFESSALQQLPEYGRYTAMDSGKITNAQSWGPGLVYGSYENETISSANFGDWTMNGGSVSSNPELGFYVGGEDYGVADLRAPYPENYWFSLVSSCPYNVYANKSSTCLGGNGGLCAGGPSNYNTTGGIPNGVDCTWNYKVLGYIDINALVGLYDVISPSTGLPYSNANPITAYQEFCQEKSNSMNGSFFGWTLNSDGTYTQTSGFSFWNEPSSEAACQARAEAAVAFFNNKTANPNNFQIPSVEELAALNPKCYDVTPSCQKTTCMRNTQQICVPCTSADAGCETLPSTSSIPTLTYPPAPTESDSSSTVSPTTSSSALEFANSFAIISLVFTSLTIAMVY